MNKIQEGDWVRHVLAPDELCYVLYFKDDLAAIRKLSNYQAWFVPVSNLEKVEPYWDDQVPPRSCNSLRNRDTIQK